MDYLVLFVDLKNTHIDKRGLWPDSNIPKTTVGDAAVTYYKMAAHWYNDGIEILNDHGGRGVTAENYIKNAGIALADMGLTCSKYLQSKYGQFSAYFGIGMEYNANSEMSQEDCAAFWDSFNRVAIEVDTVATSGVATPNFEQDPTGSAVEIGKNAKDQLPIVAEGLTEFITRMIKELIAAITAGLVTGIGPLIIIGGLLIGGVYIYYREA